MRFSRQDYEIEKAKSAVALGTKVVAASVVGMVASVSAFTISGRFDTLHLQNYISSGANFPEWTPIFLAFLTSSIFGLVIRDWGLMTLKNISSKPKLNT